ncbi:BTAD domain-containing putative transcriptional regulator [Kribbella lupini]|uniref:BTAD domain-containing putative transcriptional regulator n=1 Tax=Kribbella lupini TaxID=291602 RepID=A0ABP4N5L8_9ACTN
MFGVLGAVVAWGKDGELLPLKGPRHRAVLARLIVARGRVVPVDVLVDDLWVAPPAGAVSAVRTFVAALRRVLEPERAARAKPQVLVTEGPGYALRLPPDAVDAWRFERAVAGGGVVGGGGAARGGGWVGAGPAAQGGGRAAGPAGWAGDGLGIAEALGLWRGPAYADFAEEPWARAERSRLTELRLQAVEQLAAARLSAGRAVEAVPELDAHVTEHPWREDAWRLLALALYRSGRQGDALAVLRRARMLLVDQLGVDPSPALRQLETDILHQADHLANSAATAPAIGAASGPTTGSAHESAAGESTVWDRAVAAYDEGVGARARLEPTVGLLRSLAITGGGGLVAAREQRVAVIAAAEELGDAELTARVIGAYDVPAIWTRSDDEEQAAAVVAAAERTLTALDQRLAESEADAPQSDSAPDASHANSATAAPYADSPTNQRTSPLRARLLATIAMESRGSGSPRARRAAEEAVAIARRLDDPGVLAFALNGLFLQTSYRTGLAPERDAIGVELIDLAAKHGLTTYEVLGHLIRIQACSALSDYDTADQHAAAADRLAAKHETPLVSVFTRWYAVLRAPSEAAYRDATKLLDGAGMPGLQDGLEALAVLTVRLREGRPLDRNADYGPYEPWIRPLLDGDGEALDQIPDPPKDLLQELLWTLLAEAALAQGNKQLAQRAERALTPAAAEDTAGSGLITLGPIQTILDRLRARRTAD